MLLRLVAAATLLICVALAATFLFPDIKDLAFKKKETPKSELGADNLFDIDSKTDPNKALTSEEIDKIIKSIPEKLLRIDEKIVDSKDYIRSLEIFKEKYMSDKDAKIPYSAFDAYKKNILERISDHNIISALSDESSISIDPKEIDNQITNIKSMMKQSGADYETELKKYGQTEEGLKGVIEEDLKVRNYVTQLYDKEKVTKKELREYYNSSPDEAVQKESVRASHILVRVEKNADKKTEKEAEQKAKDIMNRLKKGEDFAALAKEHSFDKQTAVNGGDLGYFGRNMMVKEFEDAAFNATIGKPVLVRTDYGFHIVKVIDKKAEYTKPYEEVKSVMEKTLKAKKGSEKLKKMIDEIKEDKSRFELFV